jgi:hypothetical protein
MIQNLLTTPRPEMAANGMQVPGAPGLTIGGGIAGVASKAEIESIKVYNEREKYNEWEFVYDIKKDKRLKQQLGQSGQGLNGAPLPNAMGGQQMGLGQGSPMGLGSGGMQQNGMQPGGFPQGGLPQNGMQPGGMQSGNGQFPPQQGIQQPLPGNIGIPPPGGRR